GEPGEDAAGAQAEVVADRGRTAQPPDPCSPPDPPGEDRERGGHARVHEDDEAVRDVPVDLARGGRGEEGAHDERRRRSSSVRAVTRARPSVTTPSLAAWKIGASAS